MPPSKNFKPKTNCRKCNIIFTDDNKVKGHNLCRECNKLISKQYREKNPDIIKNYNKWYKNENKEQIQKYNSEYNKLNRETIQLRQNVNSKKRREIDINYSISISCRNRLTKFISKTNRQSSTNELLSCDINFLKEWFQYRFDTNMTFDNYGSYWHIDHVLPCSIFELSNNEELNICFHWTNLQPMEALQNNIKKNNIDINNIINHICYLYLFGRHKKIKTINFKMINYLNDLCVTTSNRKLCEGPRLIAVPNGKNTHKYIVGDINKLKELLNIFIDEEHNLQQDNPQPSSKIDTFILEKVQRLDGNGLRIN